MPYEKNKIDCLEFNKTQSIHTRSFPFTITNSNINYEDGAPICIKDISISYDNIGLVLPMNYTLCGNELIFDTDCSSIGNCLSLISILPSNLLNYVSTTIRQIYGNIAIAESVFSDATVYQKTLDAYTAAGRGGITNYNAAFSVGQLIIQYVNSNPSDLGDILENLSKSIIALDNAEKYAAIISNTDPLSDAIIALIVANLYDGNPASGSSISVLQTAINSLQALTDPAPPQNALNAVNTAEGLIPAAINAVNRLNSLANPTWNDVYTAIMSVYEAVRYTQLAVYYTAVSRGDKVIEQFSNSLSFVLFGTLFALCAATCLNQSLYLSGLSQICALNNSANNSIQASAYDFSSLQFTNFETATLVPLYREFQSCISKCSCNKIKCLFKDCNDNYTDALFHQIIYSLHLCNLNIYVNGNIGCDCFSAKLSFPDITSIKDIGFQSIVFDGILSLPKNISSFILKETFIPDFNLQCIRPTSNYYSMNGPTFLADIYTDVNLKAIVEYSCI